MKPTPENRYLSLTQDRVAACDVPQKGPVEGHA